MKKFSLVLAAMLVVAFAVPAMAKVNLSGAMWVTYYAQAQSHDLTVTDGNNGSFMDPAQVASNKSFMFGQDMTNNGLTAHAVRGDGLLLGLDCPVNDWVSAYAELTANDANLRPVVQEAYIDLAFMPELNVQAGIFEVPFGQEHNDRPQLGQEEVFITEYTVDAAGLLLDYRDNGIQVYGTVLDDMLDYSVYAVNGSIATLTDTAVATGAAVAMDANNAKSVGLNLCLRPVEGLYVGGGMIAGDYRSLSFRNNSLDYVCYDINAGYDFAGVLKLSGEYAVSNYEDQIGVAQNLVVPPTQLNDWSEGKTAEYIVKAIYSGIDDVELGLRYAVIDPKNIESEITAGYSDEGKLSFGASYAFARNTILKAEYSWIDTERDYLKSLAPVAGVANSGDPSDNILALQLAVQF